MASQVMHAPSRLRDYAEQAHVTYPLAPTRANAKLKKVADLGLHWEDNTVNLKRGGNGPRSFFRASQWQRAVM